MIRSTAIQYHRWHTSAARAGTAAVESCLSASDHQQATCFPVWEGWVNTRHNTATPHPAHQHTTAAALVTRTVAWDASWRWAQGYKNGHYHNLDDIAAHPHSHAHTQTGTIHTHNTHAPQTTHTTTTTTTTTTTHELQGAHQANSPTCTFLSMSM